MPEEKGTGELTETGDYVKTIGGCNCAGGWRASTQAGAPHTSPREALVAEGKEQCSWQGLQRERPRLPSRRQEASGRHDRLRLICKERGKQDFLFFPPKQKAKYARKGDGGVFVFRGLTYLAQALSQEADTIHAVGSAPRAEFAISSAIQDEIQLRRKDSACCPCCGQGSPGLEHTALGTEKPGNIGSARVCTYEY